MPEPLLSGNQQISLPELAKELRVRPERLKPLFEHGYLRTGEGFTVIKPPPAAMSWLRTMFTPIMMRPFLPTQMAADLIGCAIKDLRSLCLLYNIPLHQDAVFGELISVNGFHKFFEALHHFREPSRFDRQALLGMLLTARPDYRRAPKALRFSRRLDREIARIAKLKEPDRTERALALWESISDAKTVAAAVDPETPDILGVEKLRDVLVESLGEGFTDESLNE